MPFSESDRQLLLAAKGVGPTVNRRLEQLGYSSLTDLVRGDVDRMVQGAAALVGSTCWRNSPQARAAIAAAIAVVKGASRSRRAPGAQRRAGRGMIE
ncbi:MAG: helix-hairpin-helix domain-containing protein [Gammaproteobacteria bacterium]|nr:helix-hairpin-helix domain-containing protein [Gammaproteobacteria bacterium]